jgi:hypothetical protein
MNTNQLDILHENENQAFCQTVVSTSGDCELSIFEGLKLEQEKAFGSGDILVKIWFHNDFFHLADFVQAFKSVKEAREACEFVKNCKGVFACYIVRVKPKYELLERVVSFTA